MLKKKDDDAFLIVERGDLDALLALLPMDSHKSSPQQKRSTFFQKAGESLGSLLRKDFDLHAVNEQGYSLIHIACLNGHENIAEKLLIFGSQVDSKEPSGNTPLHLATWGHHVGVVKLLLRENAAVNLENLEGNTPLHLAAQFGKDSVCARLLLEKGAQSLQRNKKNETPLDLACRFGKIELVTLLATPEAIAGIYKKNERPRSSPLHLAAKSGHKEICRILLEAGAHVDTMNSEGSTALHEATQFGKRDCVLLLLQRGASIKARNVVGQTALELFETFNKKPKGNLIYELLMAIENGADRSTLASLAAQYTTSSPPSVTPSTSSTSLASSSSSSVPTSTLIAIDSAPPKIKVRAIMPSAGSAYDDSLLVFQIGDLIMVEEMGESGMWKGVLVKNGKKGEFKANVVEIVEDEPSSDGSKPKSTAVFDNLLSELESDPWASRMPASPVVNKRASFIVDTSNVALPPSIASALPPPVIPASKLPKSFPPPPVSSPPESSALPPLPVPTFNPRKSLAGLPPSIAAGLPFPLATPPPIASPASPFFPPTPVPTPASLPTPVPASLPSPKYPSLPSPKAAPLPSPKAAPAPAPAPAPANQEVTFDELFGDVDDMMAGIEAEIANI